MNISHACQQASQAMITANPDKCLAREPWRSKISGVHIDMPDSVALGLLEPGIGQHERLRDSSHEV